MNNFDALRERFVESSTGGSLLRFAAVGATCTALQLALFYALLDAGTTGTAAFVFSFAVIAQLNFVLSSRFTWLHRLAQPSGARGRTRRWALFNTSAGISLGVSAGVFALASRALGPALAAPCGVASSIAVSFLLGDRVVFRPRRASVAAVNPKPVDNGRVNADVASNGVAAGSTAMPAYSRTVGRGITIFLPAFNEGSNLPGVVGHTLAALEQIAPTHHVVIVDDGSTDNTELVVADLVDRYRPRVDVVHHERNLGYGHALRSGFNRGLEHDSDWVGFLDADGQFDPVEFEALLSEADAHRADLVAGFRLKRADGIARLVMGRAWHMLTRAIVGTRVHDVDCGFKLVHRNVLQQITLDGSYAAVSPELLVKARRAGFRTAEVGVHHYPRQAGQQTGSGLKVIAKSLLGLAKLRRALSHDERVANEPEGKSTWQAPSAGAVTALALLVSVCAFAVFYAQGRTLAYTDSISHLLIAQRVVHGATPGLAQLGSVWLPLPHLLMAPLTISRYLFYTGIAGSLVSMAAFVITARMLFKTAALMANSTTAGWIAALIFMANANVLYLQSTPMTEMLLFACMAAAVYQLLCWAISDDWRHLAASAVAALLATLTRYEGWVLLASMCLAVALVMWRRRYSRERFEAIALLFLTMAGAGVLGWLLWNRAIFGSFTDFATGKYAKPSLWVSSSGDRAVGHLALAAQTYLVAVVETVGIPFAILACVGVVVYVWQKRVQAGLTPPLTLLTLFPFFVVAIDTGQRPLHVRQLTGDMYNIRFGLVMVLPAALFAAYAVVAAAPMLSHAWSRLTSGSPTRAPLTYRFRTALGAAVITASVATGSVIATHLSSGVVTLAEPLHWSHTQDAARAAAALRADYSGGRILMQGFGNEYVSFVSRVPISETIYEGSYRLWPAALHDPASVGIRWIYLTHSTSDQVWAALRGSPYLAAYHVAFSDGTHVIYHSNGGLLAGSEADFARGAR